jgi:hypothetical protein
MLSRPILAALLLTLAISMPATAGQVQQAPHAVLELFTSQGCSSCPPADAVLEDLGKRPDLLTLAYHVDYWDYIGWTDTFGSADATKLQREYAQSRGTTKIYTPQLVVNGADDVVGSRRGDVDAKVKAASLSLPVKLEASGDTVMVDVPAQPGGPDAMIWLVTFIKHADITIERGENAGKQMSYSQIVTGRQMLGMWDAAAGSHLKLPLGEVLTGKSDGAVILVQQEKSGLPGPILGAASFTR